jgi:hypothetical protein
MSALDQIVYRAPGGTGAPILLLAASLPEGTERDRWLERLDPWLRAGALAGRGYLAFGPQAAFVRWKGGTAQDQSWEFAHVLVGPVSRLSTSDALQLPDLPAELLRLSRDGRLPRFTGADLGMRSAPSGIGRRSRSASAIELLVPLLSRVLAGAQSVTMPWTEPLLPEAVLWALASILSMLGDSRPISFLTLASGPTEPPAGLFVSFRRGAAAPHPEPRYDDAAIGLATGYADDPVQLHRILAQNGVLDPADQAGRVGRLLDLWPDRTRNAYPGGTRTVNARSDGQTPANAAPASRTSAGRGIICPVCLHEIKDWENLPRWRWDQFQSAYTELKIPHDASPEYIARLLRGAHVRCPDPYHVRKDEHYLPADYGDFGPPVVLGFIGVTESGKTHLLTTMVGEIERGGLQEFGIGSRPLDRALHKRFLDDWVRPLMSEGKVLPGTQEGVVTFTDGFVISPADGRDQAVALFDVAGGELTRVDDTKQFLEIADGLIFVVDPARLDADGLGDDTFNTVLDLVNSTGRLPDRMSAAVVLNKADLVRFDDPIALWLRSDRKVLDAAESVSESADVYAFLHAKGAAAWTRPYRECARATLHVASPTGGADQQRSDGRVYPRGVTPRRVLRPLVAMLAMTGVLTGAEAERVGI